MGGAMTLLAVAQALLAALLSLMALTFAALVIAMFVAAVVELAQMISEKWGWK